MANPAEVVVTCGANQQVLEPGMTVGEVRDRLAEIMNVPRDAAAVVVGQTVAEDYRLQPGEHLEFVRPSGRKG